MIRNFPNTGFTLIELLVGLMISMFLLLGVTSYFQQSRSTFDYQRAQAGQLQSERFVSFIIGNMIRHAGYAPLTEQRLNGLGTQLPAGGSFAAAQFVTGTNATHNVAVNGETTLQTYPNDSFSVRYVGGTGISRCDGTASTDNTVMVDTLSVDGVHLLCNTTPDEAILLGADDVQTSQQTRVLGLDLLYGEDLDNDSSADTFVDASGVTDWSQVLTAQVELFLQSGNQEPQSLQLALIFENVLGTDEL